MWIFSLGRTLMRALPMTTVPPIKMQSVASQCAIVLQATIWKMCNYDVNERASLMFLLNVSMREYIKFEYIWIWMRVYVGGFLCQLNIYGFDFELLKYF